MKRKLSGDLNQAALKQDSSSCHRAQVLAVGLVWLPHDLEPHLWLNEVVIKLFHGVQWMQDMAPAKVVYAGSVSYGHAFLQLS